MVNSSCCFCSAKQCGQPARGSFSEGNQGVKSQALSASRHDGLSFFFTIVQRELFKCCAEHLYLFKSSGPFSSPQRESSSHHTCKVLLRRSVR
mmetsp:Transcript_167/g.138  ORF Transcript_167/g.138 Transcript_167/m.138 type:complete len:93 (-) Transcript_167:13-291(-)